MNLRAICDEVGREIETWPYEKLSLPAEELSFSREFDDETVWFSLEACDESKSGDLLICVDCSLENRKFLDRFKWQPSYLFWKRPDGSVYYPQ